LEFKSYKGDITGPKNATITMEKGDHLSIGVMVNDEYHTLAVDVQGKVILAMHDNTNDAFLIKPSGNQYVKGDK
jgi:hypothetical protein